MPNKFFLVDQLNIATLDGHTNKFGNNSYVGLQILVYGKKAATVITEAVVGRVRVNFRGKDIVNMPFTPLRKLSDLIEGKPDIEQGTSGNMSYYGCFVPFFHPALPNAIHKEDIDNMDFYIDKAQESVDECTCLVYGVVADLPELYIPSLLGLSETAGTGTKKITISLPNVAQVMLTKPATTEQTTLQLLADGDLVLTGSWRILQGLSNNLARIEATALEVVYWDMAQLGKISDALSEDIVILSTGGVGAFDYVVQSLEFNPVRTARTTERVVARDNARIVDKSLASPEGTALSVMQNPAVVRRATARKVADEQGSGEVKRIVNRVASIVSER